MRRVGSNMAQQPPSGKPKNTLAEINRLQEERDERRLKMAQFKKERADEDRRNRENGNPGDVDFQRMISKYRETMPNEQPHTNSNTDRITICIRKRPISSKEIKKLDHDSVTCANPISVVHESKLKVDGISKYLDSTSFEVDHTFHEENTTEDVYLAAVQQMVPFVCGGGRGTVFAYGQTGSGKTHTMVGIQESLVLDLWAELTSNEKYAKHRVFVSYFEIYGGRCQDLLNERQRLQVREDGSGEVVVGDLHEIEVEDGSALHEVMETGNANRTTHATESNDESSRSHAICQITMRIGKKFAGKLALIDLAGSERGSDTKSHNQQRRLEGAEINKSLLSLKECIRALDSNSGHVPYRGSKLTLVLKDSFTSKNAKTCMIATVSPAASSADHTLNTLRYADRIKERKVGGQARINANAALNNNNNAVAPPINNGAAAREARENVMPPSAPASNNRAGALERANAAKANAKPDIKADVKNSDVRRSNDFKAADQKKLEEDLHATVEHIFEEEEALLNLHMNIIQENAELLTEEGRLLQQIQGEDNDIDAYATRLDAILERKQTLIVSLRKRLKNFREALAKEESLSKTLGR
jgi:kinesin family member 2/24